MATPTFDELKAKWDELCEKMENSEDYYDPNEDWHKYLDEIGVVDGVGWDYHWGDGGATDAIQHLIELVNSDQKYVIVEDPSYEGMDCSNYLVFKR